MKTNPEHSGNLVAALRRGLTARLPEFFAIPLEELTWEDLGNTKEEQGEALVCLILREMPYSEYLRTYHWQAVREQVMRAARWRCVACGNRASDAHHVTYERRGFEAPGDVVALCRACHDMWHRTWQHKVSAELSARF